MDREVLVEEKVEDGQRAIEVLKLTGLPAQVAAWLKLARNDFWTLCLGFERAVLEERDAIRKIFLIDDQIDTKFIDSLSVAFGEIDKPVYSDLLVLRHRYPTLIGRRSKRRRRIGNEETLGLYLYPASFDLPPPDQVVHSVLGLLDRAGPTPPSVVTFRDGSRIHAVPVGIRLNTPDGARIDWHDVVTRQDRTVPAAEVVSIL